MSEFNTNEIRKQVYTNLLRLVWIVFVFLAIALVIITAQYYSFRTDINFLLAKQDFITDIVWMSAFYMHITGSILCLAVGPFQFIPSLRKNYITLHQILGKIYVGSIFFLAAPSGLYMAVFANGGWGAQLGFTILSFLWFISTYLAYTTILKQDIKAHRKWMVRSFALTFSAVTLRLWTPILSISGILSHEATIVTTAWINWIPNIIIGEVLLRYFSKNL